MTQGGGAEGGGYENPIVGKFPKWVQRGVQKYFSRKVPSYSKSIPNFSFLIKIDEKHRSILHVFPCDWRLHEIFI